MLLTFIVFLKLICLICGLLGYRYVSSSRRKTIKKIDTWEKLEGEKCGKNNKSAIIGINEKLQKNWTRLEADSWKKKETNKEVDNS